MIRVFVDPVALERFDFKVRQHSVARRAARRELTLMGEDWERQVVALVHSETERREGERHKPNTTHLDESYTHRITEGADNGFPMRLDLTTKPGVSTAKVAAMEFGVDHDYVIAPSGTVVGAGGRSVSRRRAANQVRRTGFTARPNQWLTWTDDATGEEVWSHAVVHRAFPGRHFMSRARDIMLARRASRR